MMGVLSLRIALLAVVPSYCVHLRLGKKPQFAFTEMGTSSKNTCTQVCASLKLGCGLHNLPWKKDKDMKKEVGKHGFDCKGSTTSSNIAAPMIELKDSKAKKGKCFYPADFSAIECDTPAPDGYRNMCYCTEEAEANVASQPYQAKWPSEWIYPAGQGESLGDARKEACICYAKKKKSGSAAIAPDIIAHEEVDNGGYNGACSKFCDDQPTGKYHAADAHYLSDWSTGRPAVIVLHGKGGSKDEQYTQSASRKFMSAGFFVFALSYHADTCADDIGNAVEWLQTLGARYGVDPNSVGLYGWSQGGRCVYQAGYNNHMAPMRSVKAVVDMSGCGGKGPLNSIDKKVTTMPPPLLIAHAENDNTIKIKECKDLVKKAKSKSWTNNGKKASLVIKEIYFSKGGHNLLRNTGTEPAVVDEIFDHFIKYLGRPCKWNSGGTGVLGHPLADVESAWPTCKVNEGESVDKCGGVYENFDRVSKGCGYP